MRENIGLYRGKRKDNGEWVEGYYFKTPLTDEATGSNPDDGWFFLTGRQRDCISKNGCAYEVDPETVGEFSGKTDAIKINVFEGDILRDVNTGEIRCVEYQGDGFVLVDSHRFFYRFCHYDEYEIIGTIHDNPELMEV